jgi:hypothetical protein
MSVTADRTFRRGTALAESLPDATGVESDGRRSGVPQGPSRPWWRRPDARITPAIAVVVLVLVAIVLALFALR